MQFPVGAGTTVNFGDMQITYHLQRPNRNTRNHTNGKERGDNKYEKS